jgi:hypothetical protein
MSEFGVLEETHLTFRLAPEMELQARASACAVAKSIRMSTDKVEEVGMAVVEACINAIEHSRAADGRRLARRLPRPPLPIPPCLSSVYSKRPT